MVWGVVIQNITTPTSTLIIYNLKDGVGDDGINSQCASNC